MTTREQLLDLYRRWHALSEAEGQAIEAEDWPRVDSCQNDKKSLQPAIINATQAARQDTGSDAAANTRLDEEIRAAVTGLISLEARNSQILAQKREDAERRKTELDKSADSLRKLRKSYGGGKEPGWESFS